MRLWKTEKIKRADAKIVRYKLCGMTLLRKEKSPTGKKWNLLGIKFSKKRRNSNIAVGWGRSILSIIENSAYFDREWYEREYFRGSSFNPAQVYVNNCKTSNPSPYFNSREYLLLHPDVAIQNINPLVHYEQWGWKEGRKVSLAELKPYIFPQEAQTVKVENFARDSKKHKIVSVFASFSGNGKIADYVVYLLKNLKTVSDYIIFVADNPIFKEELAKIKDYCNVCLCERHEEYDFGSYKRGYQYLVENKILQKNDNLLFLNDSCYGPVYPWEEVITDFNRKKSDFYGLSSALYPTEYIQSFFYIFKSNVYSSSVFSQFLNNVKKELTPAHVIYNYKIQFTETLCNKGFKFATLSSNEGFPLSQESHALIPTKWTLKLLKQFRYPLVKIKALQGSSLEKPEDILEYVKQENKELYDIILPHLKEKLANIKYRMPKKISKYTLYSNYAQKLTELKAKAASGQKIKAVFFVNMTSMFPAERVMNLLRQDDLFEVQLFVIPDVRFGNEKMYELYEKAYSELNAKYPFTEKSVEITTEGRLLSWKRPVDEADIVFYPSPYDLSFSIYNPCYAAQQGILSVQLDYGFYRSKYDRIIYQSDNYNNFWRVFIETEYNREEYINYGQCLATNAVVAGYAKMDKLAEYMKNQREKKRKTIIIAPHHSVAGGTNDVLALSNFERYAELFLKLPKKYPNIDFIFRPHPVLFTILSQSNQWGKEKVQKYLKEIKSYKNVTYSTEGSYLEQFARSDGIIQDCGSYLVEYLYTLKPGCYMLKSPTDIDVKFAELGKKCLEQYYISYNEQDILNYIDNIILKGYDVKKDSREKFAREIIMINYPHASDKIITELKKELMEN